MRLRIYQGVYKASTNIISNPGLETAGAGGDDVFSGWDEHTPDSPGTDIVRDTVIFYAGAASAKIRNTADPDVWLDQTNTVIPGHVYSLRARCRGDGSHSGRFAINAAGYGDIAPAARSCGVPQAAWTAFRFDFWVPTTCTGLLGISLYAPEVTGDCWFDSVELIDLTVIGLSEDGIDWTLMSDVMLDPSIAWERGMPNGRIDALVANTGILTFYLDNSGQSNVGGDGAYSDTDLIGVPVKVTLAAS
jgi:hypothetical protein